MAGRKRRKRRMHRQMIRGIYTLLLVMAAGGIFVYSGQARSGKKQEDYPAVSWIEAQEKENVKSIEAKLAAKETAEQETEAENADNADNADKGSVVERFEGAVLVGDSVATGFLDYQILDADSIVALRGLRTDTAGKEIEKALELTPKVLFLSIGLNDLEYCRGDSGLFIRRYEERLQEIREADPDLPIYINGILPVLPEAVEKKQALADVDTFNQALKQMCIKWKLTYIDNSQLLAGHEDWYQKDAVHLKSAPYPLWLAHMEEAAGL